MGKDFREEKPNQRETMMDRNFENRRGISEKSKC